MKIMDRLLRGVLFACGVVSLTSCADQDPLLAPALTSGRADFSRLAVVGDSFAAGLQSGGLVESHQVKSFAFIFAVQVGQAANFEMNRVSEPGVPALLAIKSLSPLDISPKVAGDTLIAGFIPRFKNSALPRPFNNLAVPGATTALMLTSNVSGFPEAVSFSLYAPFILRPALFPISMAQQAVALDPTFVIVEAGINDAMGGIANGDPDRMTSLENFRAAYQGLVQTVSSPGTDRQPPKLVLVNVPSPLAYPYMTTVPWFIVNPATGEPVRNPVTGNLVPLIGIVDGAPAPLPPGSLVTLEAIGLLRQGIGIPTLLGGTGQPLPDRVVLDNSTELLQAEQRVNGMNALIAQEGARIGAPVVDLNRLLLANMGGKLLGGVELSSDYVTGGFFSLDGIHPSDIGHALAANEIIDAVNAFYAASIPRSDYNLDLQIHLAGQHHGAPGPPTPLQAAFGLDPESLDSIHRLFPAALSQSPPRFEP